MCDDARLDRIQLELESKKKGFDVQALEFPLKENLFLFVELDEMGRNEDILVCYLHYLLSLHKNNSSDWC